jgi:trimeric autotransporter adhesin
MAITTTERTQIIELVTLMFNAAPGATYLSDIVSVYEANGHNLQALAETLGQTGIYQSLNPNFQTASEFAASFLTPLGLQGDSFAVDFVVSRFNSGVSKADIEYQAFQALSGVTSDSPSQYVAAKATLDNKAAVAEFYSVTTGGHATDLTTLQNVLVGVTADQSTVTSAEAAITAASGQTYALTTGIDNLTGTSGNDTFVGQIDGGTNGITTYNGADQINGVSGNDTLKIVNANNTDVEVNGGSATNVHNLTVVNSDADLATLNVNGGQFTNVTLDYGSSLGGNNDLYVEGVDNQASFTVQNVHHFNDYTIYRNDSGSWSDASGTVSASNTLQNIDLGSGSEDMFFTAYENFTNATTINHTFNVKNVLDGSVTSGGAGFEFEDNIGSATDLSTINSTINVDNVKILGDYDEGAGVYVYGSNTVGTSTYNVTANITNTDILDFYYEAGNSGATDTIQYNVANITDTTSNTGYYSELWTSGFENITLNVYGDVETNYFGDDGTSAQNDMTVTINAQANFSVDDGAYSESYTSFGDTGSGNVTLTITGSGDVALGDLTMGDGTVGDKVVIDASAATGDISFNLQNDFNTITLGSGADTVELTQALVAGHVINGGAGVDSIKFGNAGGTLIAQDYALINGVILNFEKMELENGVTIDASKLTSGTYQAFTFDQASTITKVADGQALTAKGSLTAVAAGYDGTTTPHTYAGALNVTAKGDGSTIVLAADSATVNVAGAKTGDINVTVQGDLKTSLTINTSMGATGTTSTDNNTFAHVTVGPIVTGSDLGGLKAVTLTGVGYVSIDNSNAGTATSLATVDASALGGVGTVGTTKGFVEGGLTYVGNDKVAETISLGAGQDSVNVNGSTYAKMDTIANFDAVQESATAGKSVVDALTFDGLTLDGSSANAGLEKITIDTAVYTSLALAFTHAADVSSTDGKVVQFAFGGNTYLFGDATANHVLDDTDFAVKLVGTVDLTKAFATHVA